MPTIVSLRKSYQSIRREAEQLAGGLNDMAQRAAVYHHLFEHSGRNFVFPLIAAHGALWARGYFRFGIRLGWCCSWQYATSSDKRRRQMQQLADFADAFRDINRHVCIDTYTAYHFAEYFGDCPAADQLVSRHLLKELSRCHEARRGRRELPTAEKRELFHAFFLNEQETIVGPSIEDAVESFDWPIMMALALRPMIRFAYFPTMRPLRFRNFADTDERIANGLHAFDLAARVGWDHVEASLSRYRLLPGEFFVNSERHFETVRLEVLAAA